MKCFVRDVKVLLLNRVHFQIIVNNFCSGNEICH